MLICKELSDAMIKSIINIKFLEGGVVTDIWYELIPWKKRAGSVFGGYFLLREAAAEQF